MEKQLFIEAFDRARLQSGKKTKNGLAGHLEECLRPFRVSGSSERNLLRYYGKYIEENEDTINPKAELLNAVSQYLDFESYEDFVLSNETKEEEGFQSKGRRLISQIGKNNLYFENNSGTISFADV